MDDVFRALSDPNRRKILQLLKKGDRNVGDIKQHFGFTGASLSHHLDILKRANLVVTERRGQFIYYSLNTSVFEDVVNAFYSLFSR